MTSTKRGRPRSESSHRSVMEAVARLLDEQRFPYEEVTVEGIAAEACVGKQTIYRWWQNKAAVVLEALLTGYLRLDFDPVPDTGDLRADLHAWLDEGTGATTCRRWCAA
ncbi:TetR/AcrR family transcriptional regulator [Nesterenkonia pannonica]|uniref:TetR/AcrR family transcriptional regulator n=1 Tax=Nesterenkonia pannonica TaxID=1548602 RepID=UPI002164463F|nr:helix-turn-helix domain-containing protein [Nesterenkonia pannonica]